MGPFGSRIKAENFVTEGVPIIKGGQLHGAYISDSGFDFLTPEKAEELKSSQAYRGDLVITHRGTIGQVSIIPHDSLYEKYIVSQSQLKVSFDKTKVNPYFVNYFFRSHLGQHRLLANASQVGVPAIAKASTSVKAIMVPCPSLEEQNKVVGYLKNLDDKIELNRQVNETLEAMAQALFKSWFVDFDPVIDNALAAGNTIPDEFIERAEQRKAIEKKDHSDNQSLFPDEFEFTEEMGWIPKGWSVQSFGDLLDSTIGGDWGKLEEDEKHTKESVIIRGTDIPKLKIGERSEAPNRWVEEKKLKTRILRPFDIVIEISGGSPTQSTGRSIIITEQILERLGGVAEPASFCRKFSPSNKFLGLYAGIHLQKIYDDGKMWEYQNQSTGIANFQTTSFLEREQLVVPNESVLLKFYETLDPVISKMNSNQQIELAKIRDTLLPKLMSGELRIPDADAMTKEV